MVGLVGVFWTMPILADDLDSLQRALEVQYAIDSSSEAALGARMRLLSDPLVGANYVLNPTGEGQAPDLDPIARYDAFDCLTFVEEVYALASGQSADEIDLYRQLLRYGNGSIDFENRNHFMASQWIPSAVKYGFFTDVTADYGPTQLHIKDYDLVKWAEFKYKRSYIPLKAYPSGQHYLQTLSIEGAIQNIDTVPEGTLIVVVRQNKPDHPVWVSHLGILIYKDDKPFIRHATKMGDRLVRDDRLPWYFTHLRWFDNWPVVGVMLLAPQSVSLDELKPN